MFLQRTKDILWSSTVESYNQSVRGDGFSPEIVDENGCFELQMIFLVDID